MTKKVQEALKHVNSIFPEVTQVFFGVDGQWLYFTDDLEAPDFDNKVNISLLEDAARSIDSLPAAFALEL